MSVSELEQSTSSTTANPVAVADPDVWRLIESERTRQENTLELIASENHASQAVIAAMGTCLTNKYAEGYPGARYYGGCQFVDGVEDLARDRAKEIFGCSYVNVQPHSGAQANAAVFFALLDPGDHVRQPRVSRWRAPQPRDEDQHLRQVLQARSLSTLLRRRG